MIDMEERRNVLGFPGYTVTRDGRVFSTNNSRNGMPKEMRGVGTGAGRRANLCRGAQIRKQRKVADLVLEAWGTLQYFNEAVKREAEGR